MRSCECFCGNYGIRGKKFIKINWRGGNFRYAERNDVCLFLKGSNSVLCKVDFGLNFGVVICCLILGIFY